MPLVMLVLSIAAACILTGCPSPTSPAPVTTKFEGTWNGTGSISSLQFRFTGTNYLLKAAGENSEKGTFTFTDTQIILNVTHTWSGGAWDADSDLVPSNYSLSGNTLTLSHVGGSFTKQ